MTALSTTKVLEANITPDYVRSIVGAFPFDFDYVAPDVSAKAKELLTKARSQAKILRKEKRHLEAMRFSVTNSKLNELADMLELPKTVVGAFDQLAGVTCPFADICRSKIVIVDGRRKVQDGPNCKFRCYAVNLEAAFTATYNAHVHNTQETVKCVRTKDSDLLAQKILVGLLTKSPNLFKGGVVRWHASGDFFSPVYVEAAMLVMEALPKVAFFGYSKGPKVVERLNSAPNCAMVHSHGSRFDDLAVHMGLVQSFVRCNDNEYTDVATACETSTSPNDFLFIWLQVAFAINVH